MTISEIKVAYPDAVLEYATFLKKVLPKGWYEKFSKLPYPIQLVYFIQFMESEGRLFEAEMRARSDLNVELKSFEDLMVEIMHSYFLYRKLPKRINPMGASDDDDLPF